jgi:hypothetical protein
MQVSEQSFPPRFLDGIDLDSAREMDPELGQWALPTLHPVPEAPRTKTEDQTATIFIAPTASRLSDRDVSPPKATGKRSPASQADDKSQLTGRRGDTSSRGYDSISHSQPPDWSVREAKAHPEETKKSSLLRHQRARSKESLPTLAQEESRAEDDPRDRAIERVAHHTVVAFKEPWANKEARIRSSSSFGGEPSWRLMAVIVKSGDDLRLEQCASQLVHMMHHLLLAHASGDFWLRPYDILALSPDSGLIEAVPDTISLDALRKSGGHRYPPSLLMFFEHFFGTRGGQNFEVARGNFIISLATYCIVCYVIQLKDRHNGNILLDHDGHIIHIDFGFILGTSVSVCAITGQGVRVTAKTPGGNFGFEKAPFKLTSEFVELMGGVNSQHFRRFR